MIFCWFVGKVCLSLLRLFLFGIVGLWFLKHRGSIYCAKYPRLESINILTAHSLILNHRYLRNRYTKRLELLNQQPQAIIRLQCCLLWLHLNLYNDPNYHKNQGQLNSPHMINHHMPFQKQLCYNLLVTKKEQQPQNKQLKERPVQFSVFVFYPVTFPPFSRFLRYCLHLGQALGFSTLGIHSCLQYWHFIDNGILLSYIKHSFVFTHLLNMG